MSYDEVKYASLIDGILRKSDLNTISAKRIRKQLSESLGYDVSEHKVSSIIYSTTHRSPHLPLLQDAINKLIEKRFDKVHEAAANATSNPDSATPTSTNGANGASEAPTSPLSSAKSSPTKRAADDSDVSDVLDEPKPKKKRVKKSADEDDAAFAARLQQEENSRARPTRGGAARPVKKKTTKKKSATKVKDNSDDSDANDEPKERKGGFHVRIDLPSSQTMATDRHHRNQ